MLLVSDYPGLLPSIGRRLCAASMARKLLVTMAKMDLHLHTTSIADRSETRQSPLRTSPSSNVRFVPPRGLGRHQPQIAPPAPDAGRGVAKRRRDRRVELRRLPPGHTHRKDAPLLSNPNGTGYSSSYVRQENTDGCM